MLLEDFSESFGPLDALIDLEVVIVYDLEDLLRLSKHVEQFAHQLHVCSYPIIAQVNCQQILALTQSRVSDLNNLFV